MTSRKKEKTRQARPGLRSSPRKKEKPQRLNRIISSAGITSRRNADRLILKGRVTLNGRKITTPGASALWGKDIILVDGREIPGPSARLYLALNKPFGYISSLRDPEERPLVTELIRDVPQRVYPVGRLDFDTMGLLLLTNDGEWAHRLTHPRYQAPRTYKVTVGGTISDEAISRLRRGLMLKDGHSGPSKTWLVSRDKRRSVIRMTITRGRTRQVRRMVEEVGFRVVHLIRISFGNIQLGNLKVGEYRYLEREEITASKRLVGLA